MVSGMRMHQELRIPGLYAKNFRTDFLAAKKRAQRGCILCKHIKIRCEKADGIERSEKKGGSWENGYRTPLPNKRERGIRLFLKSRKDALTGR